MSLRTRVVLAVVWSAFLVAAGAWGHAQTTDAPMKKPFPTVISGGDFGFRVDGLRQGEAPIGTLVVRINGGWYEARLDYLKK